MKRIKVCFGQYNVSRSALTFMVVLSGMLGAMVAFTVALFADASWLLAFAAAAVVTYGAFALAMISYSQGQFEQRLEMTLSNREKAKQEAARGVHVYEN